MTNGHTIDIKDKQVRWVPNDLIIRPGQILLTSFLYQEVLFVTDDMMFNAYGGTG